MTALALLGGDPVRSAPFEPLNTIGEEERQAVDEVMRSGMLSGFVGGMSREFHGGPKVRQCEEIVAARVGARHSVSLNSASTALQTAIAAAEVEPGDEVIVPPYTMSATATAVVLNNAIPVFVDVEDVTFGLDPAAVEAAITPQTAVILVVHLFGHPARMGELLEIADRHGLLVIEDAAQSIGATWNDRQTSAIGNLGVLSLNRHKIIQTGEGGFVVTDDDRAAAVARMVRNHGELVAGCYGPEEIHNTLGSNFRLGELEAAIAIEQLRKLDDLLAHRRALAAELTSRLSGWSALIPPTVMPDCTHSYYVYAVRYNAEQLDGIPRAVFARALRAEGIPVTEGYVKPLYLLPMYQQRIAYGRRGCPWTCGHWRGTVSYEQGICPTTERLYQHELLLFDVCRQPLTTRDIADVADAIEKVVELAPSLLELSADER